MASLICTVEHSLLNISLVLGTECAKFLKEMDSLHRIEFRQVLREKKIEFSRQEQRSRRIMFVIMFAMTFIMLCCRNDTKDPNPNNNHWDQILINSITYVSLIMYFSICISLVAMELVAICLMFVSLSGVLFAYLRSGYAEVHYLFVFGNTLLIMDAIAYFIFFLSTFVYKIDNKQISDIDTEEKKAAGTKSAKTVKPSNYASMADTSMADTKVLMENIVINV